ncbi:MAG: glycoside hydrolase family 5 protein [Solirubrobacterales bacterium]
MRGASKNGRGGRRSLRPAALTTIVAALLACGVLLAPAAASAQTPLSIRIEGNHFLDGEGQTIRLLGVDRTSSEYGCVDGFGYDDGHFDAADAAAIASWNANAVRVPLNEDCWLGINGQPNSSEGAEPPLTAAGYRQEIEGYVADLNAHGIYAILDLHWTAPGAQIALEQQPMPDTHSVPFWESVAATFKSNPAVVFDLFNEPYDPTDPRSGEDMNAAHKVSWNCWRDGGCTTQAYDDEENPTSTYTVVGMQALLNAVRGAGATQPVMLGGLDFADDLSQWATHKPTDPLNQVAASFHNYQGKECDNVDCWNGEVAPVAASVPVVTGEFAQDVCTPSNFDNEYMAWADAHGVSYLAWAWIVLTRPEIETEGCSAYYLIGDYGGTPASVNGIAVHTHLLTLPPGGRNPSPPSTSAGGGTGGGSGGGQGTKGKIGLVKFGARIGSGDKTLVLRLDASESCAGKLVGQTVKPFRLAGHKKPRRVALGTAGLTLTAGRSATVVLKLGIIARHLLEASGSLKARFVLTLSSPQNATTVLDRSLTLKESKAKPKKSP